MGFTKRPEAGGTGAGATERKCWATHAVEQFTKGRYIAIANLTRYHRQVVVLQTAGLGGCLYLGRRGLTLAFAIGTVVDHAAITCGSQSAHIGRLQLGGDGEKRGQAFE